MVEIRVCNNAHVKRQFLAAKLDHNIGALGVAPQKSVWSS